MAANAFPLFPSLPAELRLRIWRAALGNSERLIHLRLDRYLAQGIRTCTPQRRLCGSDGSHHNHQGDVRGQHSVYYLAHANFQHDDWDDEAQEESTARAHSVGLACVEARGVVLAAYPRLVSQYRYTWDDASSKVKRRALRYSPRTDVLLLTCSTGSSTSANDSNVDHPIFDAFEPARGVENFPSFRSYRNYLPVAEHNVGVREVFESFERVILSVERCRYCPAGGPHACLDSTMELLMFLKSVRQVYVYAYDERHGTLRAPRWEACDAPLGEGSLIVDDIADLTREDVAKFGSERAAEALGYIFDVPAILRDTMEVAWADAALGLGEDNSFSPSPRGMPRVGFWASSSQMETYDESERDFSTDGSTSSDQDSE